MNEILILISTALVVSLDSFVAGFSLSLNKRANVILPATAALITLALCVAAYFIGTLLMSYLDKTADLFGAALLVCLAAANLFKRGAQSNNLQEVSVGESVAIGFAVGTDAAVATLSLSVDGYGLAAPLFFAVTHYFTVFMGQILARKITMKRADILSAVILLALAVIKLI